MTADESKCTKDQDSECPPTLESQLRDDSSPAGDAGEPKTSVAETEENQCPIVSVHPPETPTNEPATSAEESPSISGGEEARRPSNPAASQSSEDEERQEPVAVELEAHEAAPKLPPTEPLGQAGECPQIHACEPRPQEPSRHAPDLSLSSEQRVFRGPVPSPTPPPEEAPSPKQCSKFPSTPGKTHAATVIPDAAAGNSSSHLPPTPPPSAPREHENRTTFRGVSLGSQSASSTTSTPRKTSGGPHYSPQSERYPRSLSERSRSSGSSGHSVYSNHHRHRVPHRTGDEEPAVKIPAPDGDLAFAISGRRLDSLRLGALDKAQRFWELQNDISDDGGELWRAKTPIPPSEKDARLEMLGRDLISDLHSLIEGSVALENILKDDRLRVWSTGAAVAAGIPTFCFLTQYPSLPFNFSKFTSSFPSLPAKTISTLHSIPAHPVSRAAGRAIHAGTRAATSHAASIPARGGRVIPGPSSAAAAAAGEGMMALSAATLALSLVPTAIGALEVAMHERQLGDVQSWTEDLRHLAMRVGKGEMVDGMDMYCLSDDRWEELPWKEADEDMRDLAY